MRREIVELAARLHEAGKPHEVYAILEEALEQALAEERAGLVLATRWLAFAAHRYTCPRGAPGPTLQGETRDRWLARYPCRCGLNAALAHPAVARALKHVEACDEIERRLEGGDSTGPVQAVPVSRPTDGRLPDARGPAVGAGGACPDEDHADGGTRGWGGKLVPPAPDLATYERLTRDELQAPGRGDVQGEAVLGAVPPAEGGQPPTSHPSPGPAPIPCPCACHEIRGLERAPAGTWCCDPSDYQKASGREPGGVATREACPPTADPGPAPIPSTAGPRVVDWGPRCVECIYGRHEACAGGDCGCVKLTPCKEAPIPARHCPGCDSCGDPACYEHPNLCPGVEEAR